MSWEHAKTKLIAKLRFRCKTENRNGFSAPKEVCMEIVIKFLFKYCRVVRFFCVNCMVAFTEKGPHRKSKIVF